MLRQGTDLRHWLCPLTLFFDVKIRHLDSEPIRKGRSESSFFRFACRVYSLESWGEPYKPTDSDVRGHLLYVAYLRRYLSHNLSKPPVGCGRCHNTDTPTTLPIRR